MLNNENPNPNKIPSTIVREVQLLNSGLTIRDLASKLSMRIPELITKLQTLGIITIGFSS